MDINTVKKIFGSMPINELMAAQALGKSKNNRNSLIIGIFAVAALGVYVGYKMAEKKNLRENNSNW